MNNLKVLELELSAKCNAACPLCPREVPYIKTELDKISNEITLEKLQSWLPLDIINNLKHVIFKGTFSEPVIAKDFFEIVEYFIKNSNAKISIHTNGSLRKRDYWQKLGELLKNRGEVTFGIDGLSDTHALYRVNTNYDRIIENAAAFINGGGDAIWQYIVFKHNEHQVTRAQEIAKQLGFTKFLIIGSARFDSSETVILNKKGEQLEKNENYSGGTMNEIFKNISKDSSVSCESQRRSWIAIDWDGEVFPCCYGIGWKKNFAHEGIKLDTQKWYKMVLKEPNKTNLNYNSLDNILQFFNSFYDNLGKRYLLKTCTIYCGNHNKSNNYSNTESKILT